MKLWERLLRRSRLPIAYSEGFHPRPRISSPLALGLGITGSEEVLEVELNSDALLAQTSLGKFGLEEARLRLAACAPPGLDVVDATMHPANEGAAVAYAEYSSPLPASADVLALQEKAREIIACESLRIMRRHPSKPAREIDLRQHLVELDVDDRQVRFLVRVSPTGSLRAEEVLAALGLPGPGEGALVTRSRLILAQPQAKATA